jgi:hypothetical protein
VTGVQTCALPISFSHLKPHLGILGSAGLVGGLCLLIAFLALAGLEETFAKDLDYLEPMS